MGKWEDEDDKNRVLKILNSKIANG